MAKFPERLTKKLQRRRDENALRKLSSRDGLIDFCSNDYLGFSQNNMIAKEVALMFAAKQELLHGATGSRLLTGNHPLYEVLEKTVAEFHAAETALIFNSGYDANLGFFSCVPQRGDYIFYDELAHASIRDGIAMSHAKAFKFKHNNLENLKSVLERNLPANRQGRNDQQEETQIYFVTESVFSMDGDSPDLKSIAEFCTLNRYHLIVDEAHATGIFGNGKGLINELGLEDKIFARLVTFGKALGGHGAAWLGSKTLKTYLFNFARSLIYTTALSPHTVAIILTTYEHLERQGKNLQEALFENIAYFKERIEYLELQNYFIESSSAIQSALVTGNENVKRLSKQLEEQGYDILPILSPTVAKGQERLRICLHAFNKKSEIDGLLKVIADYHHD